MDTGVGPTLWPAPFFDSAPNAASPGAFWAAELEPASPRVGDTSALGSQLRFSQADLFAYCA